MSNTIHGEGQTKLYSTWNSIKGRTSNINAINYMYYGGVGISMCDEWFNDYITFRDWALANGYEEDKGLSIDRIDVNGNYEPNNCRWVTQDIQARNKSMPKNNNSGYKGVCLHRVSNKFVAYIGIDNKKIHLGTFKTAVEGAIAYNNYIIENNLEGFILNVIPEQDTEQIKEKENT